MSDTNNTETVVEPANVTVDQVLEAFRGAGCVISERKSYWVAEAPDFNKKCAYVGKAKRRLTRLDVSGFEPESHDAIVHLTQEEAKSLKLGAVRAQVEPKKLTSQNVDVLAAVLLIAEGILDENEGFKLGKRQATVEEVEAVTESAPEPETVDADESEDEEFNEEQARSEQELDDMIAELSA